MKRISFSTLIFIYLLSFKLSAQDTITVELGSRAKIMIYAKDREALSQLQKLDLNKIIRDVTAGLDSNQIQTQDKTKVFEYELNMDSEELTLTEMSENSDTLRTTKITYVRPRNRRFWALDFGLNNYFENGSTPSSNMPYALRVGGSRFFSFGLYQRTRLGKQKSPFSVQAGIEFSWYNFMFEGNNYIVRNDEGLEFLNYQDEFGENLSKSKLVVPYFNVPITFNARFRNRDGKRGFNLGLGGYAGVRLGGRSKIKLSDGGDKDKLRDNYFLNNWRFGLEAQAGYSGILLFFKYDLNELFEENRGPSLNAYSFGIRI